MCQGGGGGGWRWGGAPNQTFGKISGIGEVGEDCHTVCSFPVFLFVRTVPGVLLPLSIIVICTVYIDINNIGDALFKI